MARRPNPYGSDPNLRTALENIASMFAPPSGAEMAGYATANAKRAEAQRAAELDAVARNPKLTPDEMRALDQRMAVGAGGWNNSRWKFGMDDVTARRGQDITAATSAANNIRDNTRAMATTRYGDIREGDVRPAMPGSVASMFGLPEQPEQRGAIKLSQNQTATLPDGTTMGGINRPVTMDEWTAQNMERQRQAGVVTDQQIVDLAMGRQSPVTVMGPDGKTPVYASPGTAARMQMPAAAASSSADGKLVEGTAIVAGKPTQVFRQPNSPAYATADGAPLPLGTQVFEKATPQATQGDLKGTEFSDKNAIFYNRASKASINMDGLAARGYVPSGKDYELMFGGVGDKMPTSLSNALVSDAGRNYYNSAMDFMMSVLRPDTGAAFGRHEFDSYARVFIPLPGDDGETIARKKDARETALTALQGTSKGAADRITELMRAQGVAVPEQMAKRMIASQNIGANAPATPGRTMTPPGGDHSGKLNEARDAIQRGAPREAVVERLRGMGIDPGGL